MFVPNLFESIQRSILKKKRLTSVDFVSDRDLAALSCDRQRDRGLWCFRLITRVDRRLRLIDTRSFLLCIQLGGNERDGAVSLPPCYCTIMSHALNSIASSIIAVALKDVSSLVADVFTQLNRCLGIIKTLDVHDASAVTKCIHCVSMTISRVLW